MNNEEKEIDLKAVFYILISGWKLILILSIIGLIAAFSITKFAIDPLYTSNVQIYVYNTNRDSTNNNLNNGITQTDLVTSQKLVNTYIVILKNDEVLEKVSDIIVEKFSDTQLKEYLSMTIVNGKKVIPTKVLRSVLTLSAAEETEILDIKAVTKNPELSAEICTAITKVAPSVLTRVVKAGSVETIGSAKLNTTPSSPNFNTNCIIGFIAGLIIAIAILILKYILDNTIKSSEDIKNIADIPVLGEIPDFEEYGKGGYEYVSK
ncbi:MAG: Wzz/FepE/Etk N-terminal domain-containing protein [Oscillospiraceae bacterium]